MKDEAMKSHADAVLAADAALYDAGFADGVASVPASGAPGISAEQEAADIAAAVAPLHAEIDALGLQVDQVKKLKESLAALLASLA